MVETLIDGWNANMVGDNPYCAMSLDWNEIIHPGQSVEFGFQGEKEPGETWSVDITRCAADPL